MYLSIKKRLDKMLELFVGIKELADTWDGRLETYLALPGALIGGFGIFVSLLVLAFSFIVRIERMDGWKKHFQLTG